MRESEALSPGARLFHAPTFNCYVIAMMGFKKRVDPEIIKHGLTNTLLKHPRFTSNMVLSFFLNFVTLWTSPSLIASEICKNGKKRVFQELPGFSLTLFSSCHVNSENNIIFWYKNTACYVMLLGRAGIRSAASIFLNKITNQSLIEHTKSTVRAKFRGVLFFSIVVSVVSFICCLFYIIFVVFIIISVGSLIWLLFNIDIDMFK